VESIELRISEREKVGSSNARRDRRSGLLPAVVYKPGESSIGILLNCKDFMLAARGKTPTQLFKFKSDSTLDETLSLVKSVQREPIKGDLLHVEFLALSENHKIIVEVPVKVSGVPECVRLNTAMINQTAYEVMLECIPTAIPAEIFLDISKMNAGDSFSASDLPLPEGASLKSRPGLTIVSALIDRRAMSQAAATEQGKV
jgi:large subunit ribosomal protein L25